MTDSSDALAELLTLTLTVDQYGTRFYSNSQGMWHRVHGPAVIRADGYTSWWLNGRLHRTTGPAVIWADGDKMWYLDGQLHRQHGPAIEWGNGRKSWYLNGEQFTEKEFHDGFK